VSVDDPVAQPVIVGRIAGAFGVLGWVRVVSFTEPPENLLDYRPWLLGGDGAWQTVMPAACRPHAGAFVAQLREITNRDEAQALSGRLIGVPRSVLPALDEDEEFYWRDLIGLEVLDQQGQHRGHVEQLLSTGAHDVLVIVTDAEAAGGDGGAGGRAAPLLVPFLRRFVPEVDLACRRLVIDWQEPA